MAKKILWNEEAVKQGAVELDLNDLKCPDGETIHDSGNSVVRRASVGASKALRATKRTGARGRIVEV